MTTAAKKSPTQKAVGYAENRLGVNEVWNRAQAALDGLVTAHASLNSLRVEVREAEDDLRTIELSVASEIQASMPEASVAAVERAVKQQLHRHSDVVGARKLLRALEEQRNEAESKVSILSNEAKVCAARMEELGGYLTYLARASQLTNETSEAGEA